MELNERISRLDSEQIIFGSIFGLANRLQRILDAVLPELTAKQWWLLTALAGFDEPPTLTALAEASDTSHQNVRQLLNKLEAKGFVSLVTDPKDARACRIQVTAKADQWRGETAEAHQLLQIIASQLSPPELETLGINLAQIHSALGQVDPSLPLSSQLPTNQDQDPSPPSPPRRCRLFAYLRRSRH
ncbi:MAG: MarR family transcriptional regulator [Propionibacteriaceae bacterium]|jgi:DNA-binding MarR family transcriptional regulator|nr:MarR family transcriptional regulator [Propionibacteriaceae bacterium]